MNDVNVEPLVTDYLAVFSRKGVGENTIDYTTNYLRYLLPEGVSSPVSRLKADWLTERLYSYTAGPNTLRVVHSAWSGFCEFLVLPKKLLLVNPMAHVPKPDAVEQPIRFHELDMVLKIIDAQPTDERKAAFALCYGAALEVSTLVGEPSKETRGLTRNDFNEATHEVRAAGTKTGTRDRVAIIADWAWPIVHRYIKTFLPGVPLFLRHRSTLAHWHLETQRDLKVSEYPLHNARHHWAVRQLRAGAPVKVVQYQMGHSRAKTTLDLYGNFIPAGEDRAKWEREATKYDTARREAAQ